MTDSDRDKARISETSDEDPRDSDPSHFRFDSVTMDEIHVPEDHERIVGAVPVAELEELADEWETDANNPALSEGARHNSWQRVQELREVIQQYRGEANAE